MTLAKGTVGILLVAWSISAVAEQRAAGMILAENGLARAAIVVEPGAPEVQQHAAAELASFLNQITGARFAPVCRTDADGPCLLVGPEAARLAIADFSTEGLGTDGIVIRTVGDDLVLAGGHPRGTLYAVYTFLEDHLGCRWWSSTVSTIPKKATLAVGPLNVRYVPPLEYREMSGFDALDADWAARNKLNGFLHPLDAKHGGKKHVYQDYVHTFYRLIPPAKYFEDHPEWFSLIDGKRRHEYLGDVLANKRMLPAQLCLSNEAMCEELVKNLKARLRESPDVTIAEVSQSDAQGRCQCARCRAVEEEEGSPAGLLLRFVNRVAAEIEEEFPEVLVGTLAYSYTRKPPKHVKPRHNVIVRLCSIECFFSEPMTDKLNRTFYDDLVGWSAICDRLYVWDYVANCRGGLMMPHPNLRVLAPNVKFYVDHNVRGIHASASSRSPGAEMRELRNWVLAKLFWDPTRDGDALINEFLDAYYGLAAPHVKAYLNVMHEAIERIARDASPTPQQCDVLKITMPDFIEASNRWLGCFADNTSEFLTFDVLSRGLAHLKAAEAAVRQNPELRLRVQVAQLPARHVLMMRWDEMREQARAGCSGWPMPESPQEAFDQFIDVADRANVTCFSRAILEGAVRKASTSSRGRR